MDIRNDEIVSSGLSRKVSTITLNMMLWDLLTCK